MQFSKQHYSTKNYNHLTYIQLIQLSALTLNTNDPIFTQPLK